jgi:hypothetical protein
MGWRMNPDTVSRAVIAAAEVTASERGDQTILCLKPQTI